jgi:UDP-glucose 4-epimerase
MRPGGAPDKNSRVLITGASGFIGGHLCTELSRAGRVVRAAVRKPCAIIQSLSEQVVIGEMGPATDWSAALPEMNVVIRIPPK